MKRGLIILGFCFILLIGIGISGVSALVPCVQGGYMDALDCRFDDYSCQYAHRCSYQGPGTCLSGPCSVANFDEYSCKTTCSLNNGVATCYNCAYNYNTGMCENTGQCEPLGGTFCLPGLRKCGGVTENSLRQFCDGAWTTEENCSANKMGVCTATYNFEYSTIDTSCMECDLDNDGYVPYRYSSLCPLCSGLECDCDDNNPLINPGVVENCSNSIDDNCNGLIDMADPQCNQSVFTCSDSDGGNNIYTKGFVLGTDFIFVDTCNLTSGLLTEYFCVGNNYSFSVIACPFGYLCENGACNQSVIDNQSNATNCTLEGGFASELLPCCEGLNGFTLPDPETNFCPVTATQKSPWTIFRAILGFSTMTGKTVYTEQAMCYNESKGTPICKSEENITEGWYYNLTGEFLRAGTCSTCIDEFSGACGTGFSCSNCGSGFGLYIDAARASRNPTPESVKEKTASNQVVELIKQFEGFRAQRYPCSAGKPTIGYGHVITSKTETFEGINLWTGTITKEQAERLLLQDVKKIAEDPIKRYVKIDLNQNQYDALSTLVFNIGGSNFRGSTLLRYLNTGDYQKASSQFLEWNKATVKGKKGVVLAGLTRRRGLEKKLFDTAPPPAPSVELVIFKDDNMIAFNGTHMVIFLYNQTDAVFLDLIKLFAESPSETVVIVPYSASDWKSFLENIDAELIKDSYKIYNEELKSFIEAGIEPDEDEAVG